MVLVTSRQFCIPAGVEGQRWGWTFIPKSSQCDSFPCRWRFPAAPHPHAPRSFPAFGLGAEAAPGAEPWSPLVGPRPVSQPCACVCALGVGLREVPVTAPLDQAQPGPACPQSWAPAHTAGLLWLFPVDETSGFWARASHKQDGAERAPPCPCETACSSPSSSCARPQHRGRVLGLFVVQFAFSSSRGCWPSLRGNGD